MSYRGLPYFFEVGSHTFRNDCKRSQPQNSTWIVLWPQWPQNGPCKCFENSLKSFEIFQILMGGMNFRERSQKKQMSSAVRSEKITNLKMSLKSSIMSKLDHQMSRIWIEVTSPLLETTNKFRRQKSGALDISVQDRNLTKTFYTQNMSCKPSKPSNKNGDFVFLPVPILPVCLQIGHLRQHW